MKINNVYFFLRHGEAIANTKDIYSCWPEKFYNHLTQKGIKQAKAAARELKNKKIDLIFSSDLLRANRTAEIVGKILEIKPRYEKRLREINAGLLNGKPVSESKKIFKREEEKLKKKLPKGESYNDIALRLFDFFKEINKKYSKKRILIVGHQVSFVLLEWKIKKLKRKKLLERIAEGKKFRTGQWIKLKL